MSKFEDVIAKKIGELSKLKINTYNNDFLLTWDKSIDEIKAHFLIADILRLMRENNVSPRLFSSGLGISLFRDNSTRTRFSFSSACNLLGLEVQDLDEKKSQISHGETVRETSNMISFMADVIGIRDDLFIGKGHEYMKEVSQSVVEGFQKKVLEQRPTLVNLQCDRDHPTQSMSDAMHLIKHAGGLEKLKGKKLVMSWAYSPSYAKPLSVPQGAIALLSRLGMDITLCHPKGYEIMPEIEKLAEENCNKFGGKFKKVNDMKEGFKGVDYVYPKSWGGYELMKKRSDAKGDEKIVKELEQQMLAQNKKHMDWECTEELMKLTNDALYMHCLPADITDVSVKKGDKGEVSKKTFEKFRIDTYLQAGFKPYVISSMIFLSKVKDPVSCLKDIMKKKPKRKMY